MQTDPYLVGVETEFFRLHVSGQIQFYTLYHAQRGPGKRASENHCFEQFSLFILKVISRFLGTQTKYSFTIQSRGGSVESLICRRARQLRLFLRVFCLDKCCMNVVWTLKRCIKHCNTAHRNKVIFTLCNDWVTLG